MHIPPVKHQGQTISTAELWHSILINGRANWMCPSSCNHLLWLTSGTSVGPFHRWRVFWAAWFSRMLASSIEHLQLHQFCRWYEELSLFCIRDHSYFFALVKLCCSRLSDSQEERRAKCLPGGKKKRNRCPCYTKASRLMNSKPLCLSHWKIDRCYDTYHFSLTFLFIFQLISPLHEYLFCTSPTPTPPTFLMVHLTLRAVPPNLLSDAKWSSERMVRCAADVHGPSLSFIHWRIQGRGPGGPSPPYF